MNPLLTADVLTLMDVLAPAQSWIVGGAVRDYLYDGTISRDIDIATTRHPHHAIEALKKAGITAIPTGLQYGTVTAIINSKPYEITTLREDIKTNGRHAEVSFSDNLKQDAIRRDLTFNALYMDQNGDISDFFNGITDLKTGHVRFIGDASARIDEDYLRLLRFFRFYGRFGTQHIPTSTQHILSEKAALLTRLSPERLRSEFLKISVQAPDVWPYMANCGIFKTLCLPTPHKRLITAPAHLLFAAQFTQPIDVINPYFRWSNTEKKEIKNLNQGLTQQDTPTQNLYRYGNDVASALSQLKQQDMPPKTAPIFPMTADILMAKGIPPGKKLGDYLRQIESWWFKNHFPSKEKCLKHLESIISID